MVHAQASRVEARQPGQDGGVLRRLAEAIGRRQQVGAALAKGGVHQQEPVQLLGRRDGTVVGHARLLSDIATYSSPAGEWISLARRPRVGLRPREDLVGDVLPSRDAGEVGPLGELDVLGEGGGLLVLVGDGLADAGRYDVVPAEADEQQRRPVGPVEVDTWKPCVG